MVLVRIMYVTSHRIDDSMYEGTPANIPMNRRLWWTAGCVLKPHGKYLLFCFDKQKTPCRFEPYTVWRIDPQDDGRSAIRVDYPLAIWIEKGYTTSAVRTESVV